MTTRLYWPYRDEAIQMLYAIEARAAALKGLVRAGPNAETFLPLLEDIGRLQAALLQWTKERLTEDREAT
jgi:hypothetical protein